MMSWMLTLVVLGAVANAADAAKTGGADPSASTQITPATCDVTGESSFTITVTDASVNRIRVALPQRSPSRLTVGFDTTGATPMHRDLIWDPVEEGPLARAVSLPVGVWRVSVSTEALAFGSAGSQTVDYGWRLCRKAGGEVSAFSTSSASVAVPSIAAMPLATVRLVGLGASYGATSSVARERHDITIESIPNPKLGDSAKALSSAAGGAAPSATLRRRSFGFDAASATDATTEILQAVAEVVVDRAQVEGLEYVRDELSKFACRDLTTDLSRVKSPEVQELLALLRPSAEHDAILLDHTCTAVKALRMDQLASAGELLLRSILQDSIQIAGAIVVEKAMDAGHHDALLVMMRQPLYDVVGLGVTAVSERGVTNADAQRVLVGLSQAVTRPLSDPATFIPFLVDASLAGAGDVDELRSTVAAWSQKEPSSDEVKRVRTAILRAGLPVVAGKLIALNQAPANLPKPLADAVGALKRTFPNPSGSDVNGLVAIVTAASTKDKSLTAIASALNGVSTATNASALAATFATAAGAVDGGRFAADAITAVTPIVGLLTDSAVITAFQTSEQEGLTVLGTQLLPELATSVHMEPVGVCAVSVTFAVVSECQATGCDARAMADLLSSPGDVFDLGACSTQAEPVQELFDHWGEADHFVQAALDILSPPRGASDTSQLVAVTSLVFDVVDLAVAQARVQGAHGQAEVEDWVNPVAAASAAGRKVVGSVLAGDTDDALATVLDFVLDSAPDWLGRQGGDEPRLVKLARFREAAAAAATAEEPCSAAKEALDWFGRATYPCRTNGDVHARMGKRIPKLEKMSDKANNSEVEADWNKRLDHARAAQTSADPCVDSRASFPKLGRLTFRCPTRDDIARRMQTRVKILDDRRERVATGTDPTARELKKVVAFGKFAKDMGSAHDIDDDIRRKAAQKQAVTALMKATTDRSNRRATWVVSLGGTVAVSLDRQIFGDGGGAWLSTPLRLGVGVGLDLVPFKGPDGVHFELDAVELGRFIDWTPEGDAVVGVNSLVDILRPTASAGWAFGRPNLPIVLGGSAWFDPNLPGESQPEPGVGVLVSVGFYVPIVDIN